MFTVTNKAKITNKEGGIDNFVSQLDSFIDKNTLSSFKDKYNQITHIWLGNDTAHDLYVVWKKATDLLVHEPNT